MKIWTIIFSCLLTGHFLYGQNREIDSLRKIVNHKKGDRDKEVAALLSLANRFLEIDRYDSATRYILMGLYYLPKDPDAASIDTNDVILLHSLGSIYQFSKLDSAILMSTRALESARRLNYRIGEAQSSRALGENYRLSGDIAKALENLFNALQISREIQASEIEKDCLAFIGIAYKELGEYHSSLNYMFQGLAVPSNFLFNPMYVYTVANVGHAYEKLNMLDSALYYQKKALHLADSMRDRFTPLGAEILLNMGQVHARLGNPKQAMQFYHESIRIQDMLNLGTAQYLLADLFGTLNQPDSSLYYARLGFINCQKSLLNARVLDASRLLVKIFSNRKMADSAFYYQSIVLAITDSLYSPEKFNKLQLLAIREQQNKFEIIQAQQKATRAEEELKNRIRTYGLLAVLAVFLLIALILFRNNRQKHRANVLLEQQKNEIAVALSTLKTTQAQLVQSEKMASLGELTAGIAHEIQNPLNFVNNFSEVNAELIEELKNETLKGNDKEVLALADNIKANEEKIMLHGKRADAIVKGMLQHSRSSSGQKEPTDINALCDEYLRLSYYGLRAKDKDFNATMKTDFDEMIGKINIIPQEIGRVILNLINNAFYACTELSRSTAPLPPEGGFKDPDYKHQPTVWLSTKKLGDKVLISVRDNGPGIPEKILDKIFQPFFTTKPTGKGTGLGLSLAYDIIKAHGGDIRVRSVEGEGSEFTVELKG